MKEEKKSRVDNCGKKKFGWYSSFKKDVWHSCTRCLKITEKVLINIASEVSYVNILSGQNLIKNAKKWSILASFWKPEACGQTVLPDRSVLIGQKLVENAKIQKFKCDILSNFQTMWLLDNSVVTFYEWIWIKSISEMNNEGIGNK